MNVSGRLLYLQYAIFYNSKSNLKAETYDCKYEGGECLFATM